MRVQKAITTERQKFEAMIGQTDVIARPVEYFRREWNAATQADVILSRVAASLGTANAVYVSLTDNAAALQFNRSALGYQLRRPANHSTLLAATKVLASESGIDVSEISLHKSNVGAKPQIMLAILPDEAAAEKLLNHVRQKNTEPVFPFFNPILHCTATHS